MNNFDILEAIGNVDDVLIKRAKENQRSQKALWVTLGSIAACFMLVFILPFVMIALKGANSAAPENESRCDSMNAHHDYSYVVIEVTSCDGSRKFVDYDSLKAIHETVTEIISESYLIKPNDNNAGDEKIKNEFVFFLKSGELIKGEYVIELTHNDGSDLRYLITDTKIIDLNSGAKYLIERDNYEKLIAQIAPEDLEN